MLDLFFGFWPLNGPYIHNELILYLEKHKILAFCGLEYQSEEYSWYLKQVIDRLSLRDELGAGGRK